ncbi:MAG: PA2169 family four-helix-bundle protein [Aggregatilineales bacterium]
MDNKRIVSILNDLVRINSASIAGYETAADHAHDLKLVELCHAFAAERETFIESLNHKLIILGAKPEERFSVLGKLHRWLIDFRTLVQSVGDEVIITECLRGDEVAMQHYMDGMALNLPDDYHNLLLSHYKTIKESNIRLSRFSETLKVVER